MPFPLEQFFAALHLRVVTILDLEPRRFCGVGTEGMLGHDALKIHLAHRLKQCLCRIALCRQHTASEIQEPLP